MKVAIAGYGLEGKVSYRYWRQQGHQVTIVDERPLSATDLPYGASSLIGPGAFGELADFDLVIRSPGVAPSKIVTEGKIWSATNEFMARCQVPVIGVTGTKGKGTTASLIDSMLRAAGKTSLLVGNIGRPALEVLDEAAAADVVVYELSSFQLWDLERSPAVAVVLMIEPDHLDVHAGMGDYVAAKSNIRRHQGPDDDCYYHPINQLSATIAASADHPSTARRYAVADDGAAYVRDGQFWLGEQAICSTKALRLPGDHNLDNACAAISAVWRFGLDPAAIEAGLADFTGLDHRLKLAATIDGVDYYDDSIATTPGSAIAAIRSFDQPKLLILGGSDKGADYAELVAECAAAEVRVLAIGQLGDKIAAECRAAGVPVDRLEGVDMPAIVAAARQRAKPGSVVILSPAAASFDMFKSYADRGDQFIAAVQTLAAG